MDQPEINDNSTVEEIILRWDNNNIHQYLNAIDHLSTTKTKTTPFHQSTTKKSPPHLTRLPYRHRLTFRHPTRLHAPLLLRTWRPHRWLPMRRRRSWVFWWIWECVRDWILRISWFGSEEVFGVCGCLGRWWCLNLEMLWFLIWLKGLLMGVICDLV